MRGNHKIISTFLIIAIFCGFIIGISSGADGNNVDEATNWYLKGNDLMKQSRYEEALSAYEKATDADSYYSNGWFGKGNALYTLGKYEEALVAFEKVLSLDPDYAKAWSMKGDSLMQLKNYQTAADSYDRVIKLYSNDETAKANKAKALSFINMGASNVTVVVTSSIPATALQTQPGFVFPSHPVPSFLIPLVIIVIIAVIIIFALIQMKKKTRKTIEHSPIEIEKSPEQSTLKSPTSGAGEFFNKSVIRIRSLPKWEFRALCIIVVLLVLLMIFVISGFLPGSSIVSGSNLAPYTDPSNYYSLNKPVNWKVTNSQNSILISDPSDNGKTFVQIEPVILNGQYMTMKAGDVANYLVGIAKTTMKGFVLENVRESADGKFLELSISYDDAGVKKNGVYTIFVNSPYAMVSGYESPAATFKGKEPLLREILKSYTQRVTPVTKQSSGSTTGRTSNQQHVSDIGQLHPTMQNNGVKMLLPDGWTASVLPGCTGLSAVDTTTPGRGVLFLNGLHEGVEPLPAGMTPEQYVTEYMPADFAKYGTTLTNVKVTGYEKADVSSLATNGAQVKAMRISFNLNGVPCIGSLTVGTYGVAGYFTSVSYLWGIFAPTSSFFADAPTLLRIWSSIDYSASTTAACRGALNAAWSGANSIGDSIRANGEQMSQENLQGFYNRQDVYDIASAKRSDMILGVDRVYNPDTDEVYEVDQNFFQYYDLNRDQYNYQDMRELQPDEFLKYSPLNGELHIQ